ncbi:hypothetical protein ABK040_009641 [Willaertia magna]
MIETIPSTTHPQETSTSAAPSISTINNVNNELLILQQKSLESLQSFLQKYKKNKWTEFTIAGRSYVAKDIAKNIIFKSTVDNFIKDNNEIPPLFKTKPDFFGNGVTVELELTESCPTNVGKPLLLKMRHECYFDGNGNLELVKKFI